LAEVSEETFASFSILGLICVALEKLEHIHRVILGSFARDRRNIDSDPPLHHSFSQEIKVTVSPSDREWAILINAHDVVGEVREALFGVDLWVLNGYFDLSGVVDRSSSFG